jgi:hypothetical protein
MDVLVDVEHRLDHHLGVGVAAPEADLLGRDGTGNLTNPRQLTAPATAAWLRWTCSTT